MEPEQVFVLRSGTLTQESAENLLVGNLSVADSWLVDNSRARHLPEHYQRFKSWVLEIEPDLGALDEFFEQVTELTPRQGMWFPRIEYITSVDSKQSQLVLRMRPAPPLESSIVLWSFSEPDPRLNPLVKGPDLSLGMQMRRAAQMHGADEAVLLTSQGYIVEGALTSLVWFRGDVLCAPGDDIDWIPSITRKEVFAIAESMGMQTRSETVKPADLVGLEIWALSSLHGIRTVESWVDLGGPVGPARHFEAFSKRMRILSASI